MVRLHFGTDACFYKKPMNHKKSYRCKKLVVGSNQDFGKIQAQDDGRRIHWTKCRNLYEQSEVPLRIVPNMGENKIWISMNRMKDYGSYKVFYGKRFDLEDFSIHGLTGYFYKPLNILMINQCVPWKIYNIFVPKT